VGVVGVFSFVVRAWRVLGGGGEIGRGVEGRKKIEKKEERRD
jgi:hypothetical protein